MAVETTIHDVARIEREISYLPSNGRQVIKLKFLDQTGEVLHQVTTFAANNAANGHKVTEETIIQG